MPRGKTGWLPARQWKSIQLRVPVACVDVLPVKAAANRTQVGLIYRDTPHQGRRWCLIGGRMLHNEPFRIAVGRQVRESLGPRVTWTLQRPVEPVFVAEYFSRRLPGALFDPRQHAVALTFAVRLRGAIEPAGEALDYRWFDLEQLPPSRSFGFGQRKVVLECVRRLTAERSGEK